MSPTGKMISSLFGLLALVALGHDLYIWQNSEGFPFAFAALGWISKTYLPEQHQFLVDVLSPETFNAILTPVLKIPAFFLCLGLSLATSALDVLNRQFGKKGDMSPKTKDFRYTRK